MDSLPALSVKPAQSVFCRHVRIGNEGVPRGILSTARYPAQRLNAISVDKDNALPLLQASHMLDMPRIVRKCTECLEWSVDLTNCWSIAQWAEMLSCHELAKKVRNILCGNFLAMFRCEAFLELDKNMVKELLGSDDLDVDSEDRVGEALYDWLDGSVKERMSAALDMLGLLRVAHLSTAFLRFLQKSPTARPLYLAMRYLTPEQRRCRPRKSYKPVAVYITAPNPVYPDLSSKRIYGTDCCGSPTICQGCCYPRWGNSCRPLSSCPALRSDLNPSVIVTPGNRVAVRVCHRLHVYEPGQRQWTALPDQGLSGCTAEFHHCFQYAAFLNGRYCMLTYAAITYHLQFECYDEAFGCWQRTSVTFLQETNIQMRSMALVICQDRLYAFGGWKSARREELMPMDSAFCYDPMGNAWSELAPMPTARYHSSA
ncbi:kelch-like protein 28 isoform X2 [Paramacrobiotus metropolitanus]|uniref:kelch-like protein 28 isoform X2 n=1 Tax=Paramacrobiotus metropolitanus TaxID=2943436 RepID=UPI0024465124|nr:kelch-like protein 28 isoform X2 [Paramacrobiotus metropolitanus]